MVDRVLQYAGIESGFNTAARVPRAPMEIIEERTIGPSLGAENIERGFQSTLYGFAVIALFMIFYYRVFGLISVVALTANLMLLVALLSLLQATLTLPGIAAIALTLRRRPGLKSQDAARQGAFAKAILAQQAPPIEPPAA